MIPPFSILNEYFHPLVFNRLANHVLRTCYLLLRRSICSLTNTEKQMPASLSLVFLCICYILPQKEPFC